MNGTRVVEVPPDSAAQTASPKQLEQQASKGNGAHERRCMETTWNSDNAMV
jgi:hypothetical protein